MRQVSSCLGLCAVLSTFQSTLHFVTTPRQTFQQQLDFCGKYSAKQQFLHEYHLLIYNSILQLTELRQFGVNEIAQAIKWQEDLNCCPHDYESDISLH